MLCTGLDNNSEHLESYMFRIEKEHSKIQPFLTPGRRRKKKKSMQTQWLERTNEKLTLVGPLSRTSHLSWFGATCEEGFAELHV